MQLEMSVHLHEPLFYLVSIFLTIHLFRLEFLVMHFIIQKLG